MLKHFIGAAVFFAVLLIVLLISPGLFAVQAVRSAALGVTLMFGLGWIGNGVLYHRRAERDRGVAFVDGFGRTSILGEVRAVFLIALGVLAPAWFPALLGGAPRWELFAFSAPIVWGSIVAGARWLRSAREPRSGGRSLADIEAELVAKGVSKGERKAILRQLERSAAR